MTDKGDAPVLVLNEDLAKVLITGVQTTLSVMFGVYATAVEFRFEGQSTLTSEVSGIVGMVQEKSEGVLIVSFHKETIFHVLSKLYKREFLEIDKSIKDGVGEITNIIYGILKKHLNDNGYIFKQAIPTVVIGSHAVASMSTTQSLIILFQTEAGKFHVEIALQP